MTGLSSLSHFEPPSSPHIMLVWLLALAVLSFTLYIYLSPPDIDSYLTNHQASFSSTRQSGESATVRSTVNPHGTPLIASSLDFKLSDLWYDDWRVSYASGPIISIDKISVADLVVEYSLSLRALSANGSRIITAMRDGPESMALLFACTLQGLSLCFVLPGDIEAAVKAVHPGAVVIDSHVSIKDMDLGEAIPVSIDSKSVDAVPLTSFKAHSPPPSPKPTTTAFSFFKDGKLTSFTHKQLGKSIAGQMAGLAKDDRWTAKDSLLNFAMYPTPWSLLMSFVALSSRAHVIYMDHGFTDPFSVLKKLKPTIIATDDLSLRSLIRSTDDYRLLGWLQLQLRYLLQQKGKLLGPVMSTFSSTRIVYSCAVLDERHGALTAAETQTARALVGCQLVHVFCDPLPITQTTFGDYRVKSGKINFGPPVPGIETKLELSSTPKFGTLEYTKDGVFVTSREGFILNDGCFYLKQPEPDKVDVYSEHIVHA